MDFAGYSSFAQGEENNTLGALSSDTITLDNASYTVKALGVLEGKLILSVVPRLAVEFVLVVGTDEFASTDASTREGALSSSSSGTTRDWTCPRGKRSPSDWPRQTMALQPLACPVITGTARVGQTLTLDISAIADEDGLANVSYSYQWIANDGTTDTDIEDATDSAYTPPVSDVGKTIKVRVTFTDDADNQETLTSEATVAVAAAVPTAPLSLTVTPGDQSQELHASWQAPSSNGGSDVTGYKVQWKESTDSWDTEADVSEDTVTGTSHTITSLTGGVEYSVRVIATNIAGDGPGSTEGESHPCRKLGGLDGDPDRGGVGHRERDRLGLQLVPGRNGNPR